MRMIAYRTNFGCIFADMDMTAVAALPDHVAVAAENNAVFDVGKKLAVAFFMLALDRGDTFKQRGDLLIAVLPGFGSVIGVFVAGLGFAGKGGLQVGFCFCTFQIHKKSS